MAVIYRTGNLLSADEPIIVHGCNTHGVMGSGVAKAIRAAYPEAYKDYHDAYDERGLTVGEVIWTVFDGPMRAYWECYTPKKTNGKDGRVYVDYDGISSVFSNVVDFINFHWVGLERIISPMVAIPRIGAGLGGGDWNEIVGRIENAMGKYDIVVYDLGN